MPDEVKEEAQDTRSVLEEAYDKALEPEPDEEVKAEEKAKRRTEAAARRGQGEEGSQASRARREARRGRRRSQA